MDLNLCDFLTQPLFLYMGFRHKILSYNTWVLDIFYHIIHEFRYVLYDLDCNRYYILSHLN